MLDLPGVDFYHSRIPNSSEVTSESLTDMARRLPAAAALLPREFDFDVIGYGCTSAATLIGADRVAAAIQSEHPGVACTDPITAAVAALRALDAHRGRGRHPLHRRCHRTDRSHSRRRGPLGDRTGVLPGVERLDRGPHLPAVDRRRRAGDGPRRGLRTRYSCRVPACGCWPRSMASNQRSVCRSCPATWPCSGTCSAWPGVADGIDGLGRLFTRQLTAG